MQNVTSSLHTALQHWQVLALQTADYHKLWSFAEIFNIVHNNKATHKESRFAALFVLCPTRTLCSHQIYPPSKRLYFLA